MPAPTPAVSYDRRRPEKSVLYQVVQDNLLTFYGAVDDGALKIALPNFVRQELEGSLTCGMLCWGLARLACESEPCPERRVVAFSCKGRGFCPSCLGRRMAAISSHLMDEVMPPVSIRQWVLTFPFAWRSRLGYDAKLLSNLTRLFVQTVLEFYARRGGGERDRSGSVTAVQRTASDLKLQPHLHAVFLDGVYRERDGELAFHALPRLSTTEVAEVLERTSKRIRKWLRKRGLLQEADEADEADEENGAAMLAASAVSGQRPPAGPEWRRGALPFASRPLKFQRDLCVALDGFTLHAATRAGGQDRAGREALLKYILRPPIARDRVTQGPDGLVRILLKRPFADGTVAVDMDPISLLTRLSAAVPAPRFHTTRYAGVLASASKLRPRIAPNLPTDEPATTSPAAVPKEKTASLGTPREEDADGPPRRHSYRPYVELLRRTFGDILTCQRCGSRMRLVALVTDPKSVARYLRGIGEPTDIPRRAPARGPPYWKSTVLRRQAGEAAE